MLPKKLDKLFQDEIGFVLKPLSDAFGLRDLVKEPLSRICNNLTTEDGFTWALLPLIVCDAVCGHSEHALPACVGLELLKAAAEVFDDIEDADSNESLAFKYGAPLAVNAGSALLILAEKTFTRLNSKGVDSNVVVNLIDTVNSYYTTACIGQHLDLSLNPENIYRYDFW